MRPQNGVNPMGGDKSLPLHLPLYHQPRQGIRRPASIKDAPGLDHSPLADNPGWSDHGKKYGPAASNLAKPVDGFACSSVEFLYPVIAPDIWHGGGPARGTDPGSGHSSQ